MKCFGQKIRNYHCKVVLLDDQELIQEIQSTSTGQELVDNVFKHLNLIETAFFGLRFIDNTGQTHWLDPGKKVVKQLEGTEPFTLYFGVKFYAADPCKLLEEITRYQFYLQIKQDILQGRLPVPFELAAELGAYAVQSELGDYDSRRHCSGYVSEFRFIANQATELETRVAELHKTMAGQVPAVAELNYLEKVKWLDMYGVDLHPVLGEDNVDYFLGLTPSGVIVLRNKTKVGNYFWPRISKLTHKGKYFMLRVRNKSNEEQTYGFETPSRPACRHLWRCSVEHHAFFRLVQVAPTTTTSTKVNSLNARFRDSARSESSVRRRAQPQFVRTPSRRYTRRVVEGAQDSPEVNEIVITDLDQSVSNGIGVNKAVSVSQSVSTSNMYRTPSMTMVANNQSRGSDSPRSTRSAPWPAPNAGKKSSFSVPSPRSVRSAGVGSSNTKEKDRECSHDRKRSASAESNSSVDSRSHRKHRHRSRKGSDAESEVSRTSGRSHHSKRRYKNGSSRRDSGSESENCHHHRHRHRHKHRHSSSKYELVDSEVQWREAQKKQAQSSATVQQASVIPATPAPVHTATSVHLNGISSTPTVRKSGYMNSGLETESEASYQQKRRHRRSQRSRSPEKRLPDELKKHLDFQLIDTEGMSSEQLRQIPYKEIKTSSFKGGKVRYNNSVKSNRSAPLRQSNTENTGGADIKSELPSNGDSPPPPYSPPTSATTTIITASHPSKGIDSLSVVSVTPTASSTPPTSKNTSSQPSFNGRQILGGNSSSQFLVPPPPSKVIANNNASAMNKNGLPAYDAYGPVYKSGSLHRGTTIGPHGEDAGIHDINHPSPSESPDSQKVDSHHENSDSGLGTDHHEYYRGENFSSLSYTLPRSQSKGNLVKGHSNGSDYSRTKPQTFTDFTNNHEWLGSSPNPHQDKSSSVNHRSSETSAMTAATTTTSSAVKSTTHEMSTEL